MPVCSRSIHVSWCISLPTVGMDTSVTNLEIGDLHSGLLPMLMLLPLQCNNVQIHCRRCCKQRLTVNGMKTTSEAYM